MAKPYVLARTSRLRFLESAAGLRRSVSTHRLWFAFCAASCAMGGVRPNQFVTAPGVIRLPLRLIVDYRVAAAIAVMEMGISEYSVIAHAVGLTVQEVERVDMVEDLAVRQLALARIPVGESFKLDNYVRCPKCRAEVGVAPCVACRSS